MGGACGYRLHRSTPPLGGLMKWFEAQEQLDKEHKFSLKVSIPIQALKRLFRKIIIRIRRKRNVPLE